MCVNCVMFRVLAASLHGTLVVGVSQTLRRWTEGATYIRQGGHRVGHWPTFLVSIFSLTDSLRNKIVIDSPKHAISSEHSRFSAEGHSSLHRPCLHVRVPLLTTPSSPLTKLWSAPPSTGITARFTRMIVTSTEYYWYIQVRQTTWKHAAVLRPQINYPCTMSMSMSMSIAIFSVAQIVKLLQSQLTRGRSTTLPNICSATLIKIRSYNRLQNGSLYDLRQRIRD